MADDTNQSDGQAFAPSEEANRARWSAEDDAWRGYHRVNGRLVFDDRIDVALAHLAGVRAEAMLDVGCATGIITRHLATALGASRVVGIDFVDALEPEARRGKPLIEFISSNLDGSAPLPVPDASFDVVTCFETLEHLHDTDRMVAELRRVLRPSGTLVISVPRLDAALAIAMLSVGFQPPAIECSVRQRYGAPERGARVSGHVSHFTKRALLELFANGGFVVERVGQASIYSAWRHAAPRPIWQRVPLWLMAQLPVKRDVLIVRARRDA